MTAQHRFQLAACLILITTGMVPLVGWLATLIVDIGIVTHYMVTRYLRRPRHD
jgi:hypothetical protein